MVLEWEARIEQRPGLICSDHSPPQGLAAFILWPAEAAGWDGGNGWKQMRKKVSSRAICQVWTGSDMGK